MNSLGLARCSLSPPAPRCRDWGDCHRREPSLSPPASPVGASVAFREHVHFVTWYTQQSQSISIMGSIIANLSSASEWMEYFSFKPACDLLLSRVVTFLRMAPMQVAMGGNSCLSKGAWNMRCKLFLSHSTSDSTPNFMKWQCSLSPTIRLEAGNGDRNRSRFFNLSVGDKRKKP